MSKEAALRAMREARYVERNAGGAPAGRTVARATTAAPAKAPAKTPAKTAAPVAPPAPAEGGLCGHRSMNGRTCTREHGHSAKNHRYS